MIGIQSQDQAVSSLHIAHNPRPRILVVDDEPHVTAVVRDILAHEGFEVETAESGRQAVSLLRNGYDIDLLITDMRMPEVDGLELLREVHFWKGHLPVVVLTGYPTVRNRFQTITEGACEHLVMPFEIRALLNAVESALDNPVPQTKGGRRMDS